MPQSICKCKENTKRIKDLKAKIKELNDTIEHQDRSIKELYEIAFM